MGQGAGGKSCLKLGVGLKEKFPGIEFRDSAGGREIVLLGRRSQHKTAGAAASYVRDH